MLRGWRFRGKTKDLKVIGWRAATQDLQMLHGQTLERNKPVALVQETHCQKTPNIQIPAHLPFNKQEKCVSIKYALTQSLFGSLHAIARHFTSFVKHELRTHRGGSFSAVSKGLWRCFGWAPSHPRVRREKKRRFPPSPGHFAHEKRLIDTCCIYSWHYSTAWTLKSSYVHLPSVIYLLLLLLLQLSVVTGGRWVEGGWVLKTFTFIGLHSPLLKHTALAIGSSQQLRRQFGGVLSHLLLVCSLRRGPSGTLVLTSSRLGADSSHSHAVLDEVSRQSSVVDLLHVLLDLGFGVLQQVGLTLRGEMEEIRRNEDRGEKWKRAKKDE